MRAGSNRAWAFEMASGSVLICPGDARVVNQGSRRGFSSENSTTEE